MAGARDWATSDNPNELLKYAQKYPAADLTRALKFFALHCCRVIASAITHAHLWAAVEAAERNLVGLASADELNAALLDAGTIASALRGEYEMYAHDPATSTDHAGRAERMSDSIGAHVALHAARLGYYDGLLSQVRDALAFRHFTLGVLSRSVFRTEVCRTLREVIANPFRRIEIAPEWRTETVTLMARQMVTTNDFSAMPVLADALQDAGCDSDDLLAHCRDAAQTHLRGCWALELLLGPT